jgi:hypothetical protein
MPTHENLSRMEFDGVIVLSPEWSVDLPLWPRSEEVNNLVPESLLEKLIVWQRIFDSSYRLGEGTRPEGWLSVKAKNQWERMAPDLVTELRAVLEGKAELIVDLWPMTPSEGNRELQEYRKRRDDETKREVNASEEKGVKLGWRSPFYDKKGNRIPWDGLNHPSPGDSSAEES